MSMAKRESEWRHINIIRAAYIKRCMVGRRKIIPAIEIRENKDVLAIYESYPKIREVCKRPIPYPIPLKKEMRRKKCHPKKNTSGRIGI